MRKLYLYFLLEYYQNYPYNAIIYTQNPPSSIFFKTKNQEQIKKLNRIKYIGKSISDPFAKIKLYITNPIIDSNNDL